MDVIVYGALCPPGEERALARRLLALALERECGLAPLPEIRRAEGGKPYFPACPGLHFNLSHSHGGAVCALHDRPVGVDIERLRPAPRRLSDGLDDEAFFRLWTAREATVKRRGEGLAALLRPVEPDPLCRRLDGLLPGWLVAVCPGEDAGVRAIRASELEKREAGE